MSSSKGNIVLITSSVFVIIGICILISDGQIEPTETPGRGIEGGEVSSESFWISSSGKTHNESCKFYGTTQKGSYSKEPSGDSCKICGGSK